MDSQRFVWAAVIISRLARLPEASFKSLYYILPTSQKHSTGSDVRVHPGPSSVTNGSCEPLGNSLAHLGPQASSLLSVWSSVMLSTECVSAPQDSYVEILIPLR